MAIRESYSDSFSGAPDSGIRAILEDRSDEENAVRLRKMLLNVINNELTPRQKEIIMLYYFQRMDTVSIAKRLGVTQQAVSGAMSRARMRMYRVLQYYLR